MFLRALTIKGFKSFADPATLTLEPGVTVVVGPNGSGKSNVVDAVAWVLGAQAPSAVRSSKMDDVIFAGTARRPALGRAEVTLTLDNSSRVLPIDLTEVTLRRTLFRTGESEYAINGAPCRLLDLQELLSDAGVGRQQHVIVSQGQIDAVLNARPEDRRSIIEEAAGVLKFRKRKEKAERRLEATEGNLLRVSDLLREVRRQLRPLERQAEAARRHGELTAELTALRVFLAGREITGHRTRLEATGVALDRHRADEASWRAELVRLDVAVVAAEAELAALGGFDLGDALVRAEQLRERARGLTAVVGERRRGLQRDRQRLVDAGLVATLEADAARTAEELAEVDADAATLGPEAEDVTAAEREVATERARLEAELPATSAGPSAAAALSEARSELRHARAAVERAADALSRLEHRLSVVHERAATLTADRARLDAEIAERERALAELSAERSRAGHEREAATAAEQAAVARAGEAETALAAWRARAEALASALDEARARAGAERLSGVEGVLGALVELVEIDDGWEAAFSAAVTAGDPLTAVVVDGVDAARRALADLASSATSGAVVVPASEAMAAHHGGRPLGEPLRAHVRARHPGVAALLDELLDQLLDDTMCVEGTWRDALDASLAHPGSVAVTRAGDRFGPGTWRVGAAAAGATAAALDEARQRSDEAATVAERALADRRAAASGAERARTAEAEVAVRLGEATTALATLHDRRARLDDHEPAVAAEAEALTAERAESGTRLDHDRRRVRELEAQLPGLEHAAAAEAASAQARAAARERLEERAGAVAALRRDLEVRAGGLEERRRMLLARRADLERRLAADAAARALAAERREEVERALVAVDRIAALVERHAAVLDAELSDLNERRRRQSEAARAVAAQLDGARGQRGVAERGLEQVREHLRRAELESAEVSLRLEAAIEGLRRDLDVDPDTAIAASCPPLPEGLTAAARARELERELRLLGPINPLALEEHSALLERHDFLASQLEDVKTSRRELLRVIRAIDAEIQTTFAAAFADVSGHFAVLFTRLFPGGVGRLVLTAPDDLLSTGIEVEAKPSGKNVKKLSLLSGGERSLTALAFLFAVFRARPSPFYVMDEVEAALDDVNLHRFLGLVDEFRREAQLIVVSHQKRTMEAADCLFGVTMAPGGSSQVVSERLRASA